MQGVAINIVIFKEVLHELAYTAAIVAADMVSHIPFFFIIHNYMFRHS